SLSCWCSSPTISVCIFLSANIKFVLIATIIVLGEGVVWYSGQFWALHFLQQVTKVDALTTHPSNRVVSGMPASVHFLSPTPLLPFSPAHSLRPVPYCRHKLRNAGQVFATNRETRIPCGEIRLKQACGRC